MSTQAYKVNIKNVIYFYKYLLYNYLHLRPACDPFICVRTSSSLSSGGPDEWGVCAVGVVAVGVSPGVDKVVGRCVGKNHGGFRFEVPFGAGDGR